MIGPGTGVGAGDCADAAAESGELDTVRGERAQSLVSGARSLQTRASNFLAAALMIALGLGTLTWYYAHAYTRQTHALKSAQASAASRAQGEMALPALGPVMGPAPRAAEVTTIAPTPPDLPLAEAPLRGAAVAVSSARADSLATKSPGELARERRLLGAVFTRESATPVPGATVAASGAAPLPAVTAGANAGDHDTTAFAGLLVPAATPATQAQRLADARFLLPKGTFIDCTLETAIDSTLPGMTTCVTAADTFSADGKVVLLDRGTKLVGETRGGVQQGQARLFVLWTQARTPTGVLVPLDSPGTDALGRAGVTGEVQRHFWQRFGAAILVSVVEGAVQAAVQAAGDSHGSVLYAPSGSPDVLTEALKDSAHIAPTITVGNGARLQVLVARDIDFRPVYELRAAAGR